MAAVHAASNDSNNKLNERMSALLPCDLGVRDPGKLGEQGGNLRSTVPCSRSCSRFDAEPTTR